MTLTTFILLGLIPIILMIITNGSDGGFLPFMMIVWFLPFGILRPVADGKLTVDYKVKVVKMGDRLWVKYSEDLLSYDDIETYMKADEIVGVSRQDRKNIYGCNCVPVVKLIFKENSPENTQPVQ